MSSTRHESKNTMEPRDLHLPQGKRVGSKDVYDWALYELSRARRVESGAGSELRQQIVFMRQKNL